VNELWIPQFKLEDSLSTNALKGLTVEQNLEPAMQHV